MSAVEVVDSPCAVVERADLGRLVATGPDLLGLLHRLSTADVKDLQPGAGRETVVSIAKGRIVERVFVHHLGPDGVLLLTGRGGAQRLQAHLKRYTFAEDTRLSDVTDATFAAALLGARWDEVARAVGIPKLDPYGAAACTVGGVRVHAVRTNGFDANGALVVGPIDAAGTVLAALTHAAAAAGGGAIDAGALEAWRILKGLPATGSELTEDYNPLEAGLRDAVSFTKGCYVGQEVVARLNTYAKVSRGLVVLELEEGAPVPAPGAPVVRDGGAIGSVTSAALPPGRSRPVALAYVKTRDLPEGATDLAIDDGGTRRSATRLTP